MHPSTHRGLKIQQLQRTVFSCQTTKCFILFYWEERSKIQKITLKSTEENIREKGIACPKKFCRQRNSLLAIIIMQQKL